jgi:GT2 family glycosyltransferase
MKANMAEGAATETAAKVERSPRALSAELTVIVVTWNTRELTMRCLETLFDNTPNLAMRVIVADNHSEDGSAEAIAERFPQIDLIRNVGDLGFAGANNGAMELV